MASLRQLPSGNWQASVLPDDGRRTTATRPTANEALEWALKVEEERDERRAARAAQSTKEQVELIMSELVALVEKGQLTEAQQKRLQEIANKT